MTRVALVLALAIAGPARAVAQQRFGGSALVGVAEHRVDAGFGLERSRGPVVGGVATVHLTSRLRYDLHVLAGSLEASTPGAIDRDIGEIGLSVTATAASWLDLRGELRRRAYSSTVARQAWTLVGIGGAARLAFSGNTTWGVARMELLPIVSVHGLPRPDWAFRAAAGMEYHVGSLTLAALYSLERCDFPAEGAARRREQLAAVTLRASVGRGRRGT